MNSQPEKYPHYAGDLGSHFDKIKAAMAVIEPDDESVICEVCGEVELDCTCPKVSEDDPRNEDR